VDPIVSIVIPTYKASQWIEETLESVIAQTIPLQQLEILIVDDKSPDDSAKLAVGFLTKHAVEGRVILRKANGGPGAARNQGWKMARGEWIQFLDQDDLLTPHKLEVQVSRARAATADVAVVYSSWQYYELVDGKWQPNRPVNDQFIDDDPLVRTLRPFGFGYVGPTLIRKSMLARIGGFSERPNMSEDMDLMLRIGMAGGKFLAAPTDGPGLLYRQSPTSLWRQYSRHSVAMRNAALTLRSVHEFFKQQNPQGLPMHVRDALAWRYANGLEFYQRFDPRTFRQIMGWIDELGVEAPPDLSRSMSALTRFLGFERALRVRTGYRRYVLGDR